MIQEQRGCLVCLAAKEYRVEHCKDLAHSHISWAAVKVPQLLGTLCAGEQAIRACQMVSLTECSLFVVSI